MNVQKLFEAVKIESGQPTLLVAVAELERQGYSVTVNRIYNGSNEVVRAEERGELNKLPVGVGIRFEIKNEKERQVFRLHFLDLDAIGITAAESPPIIYDPGFTINEFR